MTEKTQTAREVSQFTAIFVLVSAVGMALFTLSITGETEAAVSFGGNMALVFTLFAAAVQLVHIFKYNDSVRGIATRVIPKRWFGERVEQ